MSDTSPLPAIGIVRTSHRETETTPLQAALNRAEEGVLMLDEAYAAGLAGLDGFDYAWLLTWLGRPGDEAPLVHVPFLLRPQQRSMGIFATRGPRRPNSIGLSLVGLAGIEGTRIRFTGVDLLDGTPVLDLKPYVRRFDDPGEPVRCGWLDEVDIVDEVTPAKLGVEPPC